MLITLAMRWGDKLYFMGRIAGPIVVGFAILCVLLWMLGILEKPLARLWPQKTIQVEIREIVKNTKTTSSHTYNMLKANKMARKEKVIVEVLDGKKKVRTFLCQCRGFLWVTLEC